MSDRAISSVGNNWRIDRLTAAVIFLFTFACYAYFFAGADWNSMSHFATIRSIVEHHTADISAYTSLTGDVSTFQNGTFSSKPPGLALLGLAPYFCLIAIERWCGVDIDAQRVWLINLHVMAALLSALPGAILNVLIYFALRRQVIGVRLAMLLTGAFAFGSLSWPYSSVLMAHVLCAMLVFASWMLLTRSALEPLPAAMAGAMCGMAVTCDLLIGPVCAILVLYLLIRRAHWKAIVAFIAGPCAGVLLMLLYNRIIHGHAMDNGPLHPTGEFTRPGLLFGMLDWPQWWRLYWITLQPMRGLLWCCPLFVVPLCGLFLIRRPFRMPAESIAILLILLMYVAFYLSYLTWTGGWGIGLRFMIPALPLAWLFASKPARRFPKVSAGLIAWSIFNMMSITATKPMFPTPNSGPPIDTDPVAVCRTHFLFGELNQSEDGHNIASLMGVTGGKQMIPVYALVLGYFGFALARKKVNKDLSNGSGKEFARDSTIPSPGTPGEG